MPVKEKKALENLVGILDSLRHLFRDECSNISKLYAELEDLTDKDERRVKSPLIKASIRNCEKHKSEIRKAIGCLEPLALSRGELPE